MDSYGLRPRGAYRDRIITSRGLVIDRGWRTNRIVERARFLIAGFMRGDESTGIESLFVGRGEESWDTTPPGAPPPTTQQLTDPAPHEIALSPSDIEYLDAAGSPTGGPTNRLRIVVALGPNEPPGEDPFPLREFGLFGTFGGTLYMINCVRHDVTFKGADDTLERTIQLVF